MAIRYHYDLYPRTDPRDGARITRFTKLQRATYRDVIGVGSGVGVIRSTDPEADDLDPRGEQFIRVVREDTVAETEATVGGFWINNYRHDTAVAKQTKRLTFAGAGTMAYLARSRMAPHTYIHAVFTGQDPFDGRWQLYNQSTVYANGNYLGAMLWRVIYEAQHWRNGTPPHRHKDGVTYTDTHADDRLHGGVGATAIPDLVMGFDQFEDSDGNAWTAKSGEFTAAIGENVLSVVQRLMQAGLYVEMDPVTFELRAWENNDHRRDRTGGAWGASVVRFQAPTDGTVATGNMLSDSEREINSHLKRSLVWAGGQDAYAIATGTSDIPWEGFENSDATELDALEQLAETQLTAREEAADAGSVRMKLGASPLSGRYRPWEEVRLDDAVTLDTGSGVWDYTEDTYPVAGLRIELQKSGAWWAWAELGNAQPNLNDRRFQVAPVGPHTHPFPELCRLPQPGSSFVARRYFSEDLTGLSSLTPDAAWNSAGDTSVKELQSSPDGSYGSTQRDIFVGVAVALDDYKDEVALYAYQITDAAELDVIQGGGGEFLMQCRARSRTGIGVDDAAQFNYPQTVIRIRRTSGGGSWVGTALAAHSGTPGVRFAQGTNGQNRIWSGTLAAVAGAALNDWVVLEVGTRHITPVTGAAGAYWFPNSTVGASDLPANDETSFDTSLNSWVQLSFSGSGATTGDLPLDTVHQDSEQIGTSVRAARCDHQHAHGLLADENYHSLAHLANYVVQGSGAPGVDDDEGDGYAAGTIWIDNATEQAYLLLDPSIGAAIWVELNSTAGSTIEVEDEGTNEGTVDTLNFSGAGVSVTVTGSEAEVIIPGGGSSGVGLVSHAGPQGWSSQVTGAAAYGLAGISGGNAGALAVPILIGAPMVGQGIAIVQRDTATARAAEFRLYLDNGDSTVDFVTGTNGTISFTPTAISIERGAFSGVPVTLTPGLYWAVIRTTGTSQISLARGSGAVNVYTCQTHAGIAALGASLELRTGWTTQISVPHIWIEGRVLGLTSALT